MLGCEQRAPDLFDRGTDGKRRNWMMFIYGDDYMGPDSHQGSTGMDVMLTPAGVLYLSYGEIAGMVPVSLHLRGGEFIRGSDMTGVLDAVENGVPADPRFFSSDMKTGEMVTNKGRKLKVAVLAKPMDTQQRNYIQELIGYGMNKPKIEM